MKVWEGKQVFGFLLTWRLLRPQLQQQMTDKYIISLCYIGAQSDLTQVTTLKRKIWSWAPELKWTKIEQFWMWIVNSDRQFCRTWYVISWTVALILLSSELYVWNMCLYHSKTLLVKQGTFLYEVWPYLAEKRDILNTGSLDISGL